MNIEIEDMNKIRSKQVQRRIVNSFTPIMGNRRVYSTSWLNRWVNYERNHPIDRYGEPIRVINRVVDSKLTRSYMYDKDMATKASVSTWTNNIQKLPNDLPYLRAKRIGSMSLYAISCLSGEKFVQAIERECHSDRVSMSLRHRDNRDGGRK